jgi:hypothetical protein
MQCCDLQSGLSDEVAQFDRLDDFGFGAEGEYLGGCRAGRCDRQPRFYPAGPSGRGPSALPAHAQAIGPPAEGCKLPAVRG